MRTTRPLRNFSTRLVAFLRDRRGVAAIEFAFIAPLLLLLYFGTVDTANWYMAHRRLVLAGSTVADLTTQSATSVKSTDIKSFWDATSRIVDPASVEGVTVRDFRVDGSTAKQQWTYSPLGTCGSTSTAEQLQAAKDTEMTDGNDIVVVEVCTTIQPIALQIFGFSELDLHYKIAMRPRLSKTLDCTSGCS
jgi:Flp pilus assembly protein TadG